MSDAKCPHCGQEMGFLDESEVHVTYFCCSCGILVTTHPIDDYSVCIDEEIEEEVDEDL